MDREEIVEQCLTAGVELVTNPKDKEKKITNRIPCPRIDTVDDKQYCQAYFSPASKWRTYTCNLAAKEKVEEKVQKINPLKASKRAAGSSGK